MEFSLISVNVAAQKSANHHDQTIQLSSKLSQQLQLNNTKTITISLGKTAVTANIQIRDMAAHKLLVSDNIFRKFSLPLNRYKFQAFYQEKTHTLLLGPVIGLVTDFPVKEHEEPNFRSIHAFCEELHRGTQERGGLLYVYRHDQFPNQGYYFNDDTWVPAALPLPDVIYNRIHSRKLEYSPSFKRFRSQLEQLGIPLFNDRFLSKWDVYQLVSNDDQLISRLPETKIFSKENLYDFVQTYETVFLKPVHGSQGRNIIKITRESAELFSLKSSLSHWEKNPEKLFQLSELYPFVQPLLRGRIYVIQQGIPFLTYETRAVDFRVLCHKNSNHHWGITSIIARIGGNEEFVSNLARGGSSMKPLTVLQAGLTKKGAYEALAQIKALSLAIAEAVSISEPGITGELGIDIGVDLDGTPWLIEVNSKPSKGFEDDQGKIRPSARALIQFCTILAFDFLIEKEN